MGEDAPPPTPAEPSKRRLRALQLLGVAAMAGFFALVYFLDRGTPFDPLDEVESFVAGLREGQQITPLETTDETASVLELLRLSTDVSIEDSSARSSGSSPSNLESGTACVVLDVEGPSGRRRVNASLRVHEGRWTLADMSTRRRCQCEGLTGDCAMAP